MSRTHVVSISLVAAAALTLTACANGGETTGSTESSGAGQPQSAAAGSTTVEDGATNSDEAAADEPVTLDRGVVRATTEDNPMTSVFGTLQNNTGGEVNIVGLTADIEAETYEIHEVVDGTMQEKEGGITIPAGENHEMAPGGEHFMFMGLAEPIEAGDAVTITLDLADGSTTELTDIPVRTMGAGDEDYGDLGTSEHGADHETSGMDGESAGGSGHEH